jgi:hypothetical protein
METREIKITLSTAERWINGNDAELKELALTTFPEFGKKTLPKSWEEFERISGFFIDASSFICNVTDISVKEHNKNVFATREQAEASIALAQLSQLMKVYNDGWVADWNKYEQTKYTLTFDTNKIIKTEHGNISRFLNFKDAETRDLFLENFSDLILTAKPLL